MRDICLLRNLIMGIIEGMPPTALCSTAWGDNVQVPHTGEGLHSTTATPEIFLIFNVPIVRL